MPDDLDEAFEELMRRSSEPLAASSDFERRLRMELFVDESERGGVDVAVLEPEAPGGGAQRSASTATTRTGRRRALAGAALLVLIAGLVWLGYGGVGDTEVVSDLGPTTSTTVTTTPVAAPGSIDLVAAQEACIVFAEESFGDRDRLKVVGPNNVAHLGSDTEILAAVARLSTAFGTLRIGLEASSVGGPDFEREAARVEARLASAERRAATGQLSSALTELNKVEELLIAIDTALTIQGVPQCF